MPKFELEDIDGNQYTEKTRKHLPARLTNECEAKYNASVKATRANKNVESDNVMQARNEIKNRVIEYLNENDFVNNLGPDRISPGSQEKVLKHYQEYLAGIKYEQDDAESGTGNPGSGSKEKGQE